MAYDKTPVEVTDSRGYVYYTTDGTEFSATSTTTDLENALVYPGKAVVDVPDYFDLTDNNEIYLTGFIDGMSKDTNLKLKLTAKNEDNTPVVKTGTAHISQFGENDVTVNVNVTDDVITDIEVTGANFAGTNAETNKMMLEKAVNGLKGSYINKSATDVKEITGVDAVSGATYSSNAIRDAILNALELKQEEEVINLPTEKLAEGEYSVDIAYYTDKVKHSLVENDKTKAKIVVDKDGSMTLVTDIINGTSKEPLYIYGFNGYYEGNDTSKSLKEAAVEMNDIQYSDDVFGEDDKDVTKDSINAAMKAAASESFGYNEDQIVSSDVIGMRYGSLFDATQTMVAQIAEDLYEVQVVSWYDNENSYTSQMVRTIKYFAELG